MPLKASDLTYDMKQNVLSQIRSQTGDGEYDRLVRALGEDGLIDLVLEKMNGTTNTSAASYNDSRTTIGSKVWNVIKTILGILGFLFILWLWGREPWSTIFNCLYTLFMISVLINAIIGWFTN